MKTLLAVIAVAFASPAFAGNAEKLAATYQPTLGEMMALTAGSMLRSLNLAAFEKSPVRCFFNRKASKIVVMVIGDRGTIDLAKKALESVPLDHIIPFLREEYGVELSVDDDFNLVYFGKEQNKVIVQRVGGHYVAD